MPILQKSVIHSLLNHPSYGMTVQVGAAHTQMAALIICDDNIATCSQKHVARAHGTITTITVSLAMALGDSALLVHRHDRYY